jgi:hypothetical protein
MNEYQNNWSAPMRKHQIYRPFEILEIISPAPISRCLSKIWEIQLVFHVGLIEPFVKGNRDINLNPVLKTSDANENGRDYDIDKVLG